MTLETVPRYGSSRTHRVGEHAVVVGGSVAGLLAARVLADSFERVTVLDRDPLGDESSPRDGVPQSRHVHVLLEAGRATLEDLVPGYGEELLSTGGLVVDWNSDVDYWDAGSFIADGTQRIPLYTATRPLIEGIVRRRVADRDGVAMRGNCHVRDYRFDDADAAVEGVVVREGDGSETTVDADLVVDATGRTSRTPAVLEAHGYEAPAVSEVAVDVGYSTAFVERPAGDRRTYITTPSEPRTRGGGVVPVEDGRWMVTLIGIHGDHPPTDREGFAEFAASLPFPEIGDVVARHPWTGDGVEYYPFPSHRRHHYERMSRFPEGFVVVGDAVASFNPIYGQGMSVAALEALQLHHALAAGGLDDVGRRFFERTTDVVDVAWTMAVGSDAAFEETTGPTPRGAGLLDRYLDRVLRQAHTDPQVADAFVDVLSMRRHPTALLRPRVLWRVLSPASVTGRMRWFPRPVRAAWRALSATG